MPRKTYKPEEIVGILRDVEIRQGQGQRISNCCREKGISEAIYYPWKKEYGGMHPSEAKRLKELERENNWPPFKGAGQLIKPFLMFGLAAFFIYVVFKNLIPADLAKSYVAGAVLLGAAPLHGDGVCME